VISTLVLGAGSVAVLGAKSKRGTARPKKAPVAAADTGMPRGEAPVALGPAPWEMIAPLAQGDEVGLGWKVAALLPIVDGSAVLVLRDDTGRNASVRICKNEGRPVGVAHTAELDFLVMNGGDGHTHTDETVGRVVLGLASRVTGAAPAELRAHHA
jgi:hypothetical protein